MDMQDYISIQNLVFSYARYLDKGDIKSMASLFSRAEVVFPDGISYQSDASAIEKAFVDFVRIYPCGTPRTRHMTSNFIIDSFGENYATSSCYVMVFQQTKDLPLQPIIGGDYRDEFKKENGEWFFSRRVMGNDLFGDLSAHGKYEFSI